jgi:hypothetical protein
MWLVATTGSLEVNGRIVSDWAPAMSVVRLLTVPLFAFLTLRMQRAAPDVPACRLSLFTLSVMFCFCLSSVVWPHYLVFLLPSLMLLAVAPARLPRSPNAAVVLALVSTLAVQSRPLQAAVLPLLSSIPWLHGLVAGLFGSCTTILFLLVLTFWSRSVARSFSTSGQIPSRGPAFRTERAQPQHA